MNSTLRHALDALALTLPLASAVSAQVTVGGAPMFANKDIADNVSRVLLPA